VSSRYKQVVEALHSATATTTGYAYLDGFVMQMGRTFSADCAMVAALDSQEPASLRSLALSTDGRIGGELVWPLADSPGAELLAEPAAGVFRAGVQEKFPRDSILLRLNMDSYIGVPLVASEGDVLGLLILMGRKPLVDDLLAVEIAQLFADRVVAEMERLHTDCESREARERLEQRVQRLEGELKRTRHELENLAYAVSHDLRGPLRAIKGFSENLSADYADRIDEVGQDHLRRLRNNATYMDELINALLTLSRVTRHNLQPARVNLSRICREVLDRLRARDSERQVSDSIQPDIETWGDPGLLAMLMELLLSNAWKFTAKAEQARITFSAYDKDGATVYRLADNGAGFDMAYAGKLFSMFQRLHGRQAFPGIGAGLATARCIVDRHGGRIWAEAETGKGASVYFTLPPEAGA